MSRFEDRVQSSEQTVTARPPRADARAAVQPTAPAPRANARAADGRDKPKTRRGVRRPGSSLPQYRAGVPWWRVYIFLGDQCDWAICGDVQAFDDPTAIKIARETVAHNWPHLTEVATNCPAIARPKASPADAPAP